MKQPAPFIQEAKEIAREGAFKLIKKGSYAYRLQPYREELEEFERTAKEDASYEAEQQSLQEMQTTGEDIGEWLREEFQAGTL